MKKITTFLGFVGVVSMFFGCSSDETNSTMGPGLTADYESSSSEDPSCSSATASSSSTKTGSSSSTQVTANSSSANVVHDTVTTHVIISATSGSAPYFSSGSTFCWSAECEAQWASSSSTVQQASSSSYSIEVTMSSEEQILPMVTETQMIDQRDQKTYKLQTIAGTHWMAENLNYETAEGSYCRVPGSDEDLCETYGRFYLFTAARKACPTGWRLPTLEEVQAADEVVSEDWWTLGGRIKFETDPPVYGLDEQQGYWWMSTGTSWRVQPDKSEHVEQKASSANDRAYSVRCVENK